MTALLRREPLEFAERICAGSQTPPLIQSPMTASTLPRSFVVPVFEGRLERSSFRSSDVLSSLASPDFRLASVGLFRWRVNPGDTVHRNVTVTRDLCSCNF